tara:strand:+ start:79 stop:783 length:705 start_codon:yes stop_codon:yes gene_type:complete
MKKLLSIAILGILLIMNSCSTTKNIGLTEQTGFVELPFPSNNYKPGQIIEVYSRPSKVEITHQPSINWDQLNSSPGWNISSTQTKELKRTLSAEISNILKGKYDYASSENVKVEFTNTKTTVIQKSTIYSAVKSELKNNTELNEQITDFMDDGTHFDVITSTLSANISFTLVNSSNQSVDLDSEVIEQINSQFDIDFSKGTTGNRVITGENLVVGIHKDPKIVKLIMKRLKREE